jgi:hypothetical protein
MNKMITVMKNGVNKIYLVFLLAFVFSLIFSVSALYAHSVSSDDHGKSVESILQDIRAKQGIGPNESIDPRKVSNRDLEELGDAVMGLMFPDPEQHEYMDNMMGGEGSRSLELMHRRMGYNYLAGKPYDFNDVRREIGGGRRGGSAEERGNEGHGGMMGGGMM